MREQIEYFLVKNGFSKLVIDQEDFCVYFQLENSCVTAIDIVDANANPKLTQADLEKDIVKNNWHLANGGELEVHILTLVLTDVPDETKFLGKGNPWFWMIDTKNKELIIRKKKVPDFYGMKAKLLECINTPFDPDALQEEVSDTKEEKQKERFSILRFLKEAPVNHTLIAVNVILFILSYLIFDVIYEKGVMSVTDVVEQGEWYRLVTSMFLHFDGYHLMSNMITLYLLGGAMERALGHVKYFILYIFSGISTGIFSLYMEYVLQDFVYSLGASGAVFGILGAFLWVVIRNHGNLEDLTIGKVVFLILLYLYSGFISPHVNNAAHVGGVISGFLLCIILYRKRKKDKENNPMNCEAGNG